MVVREDCPTTARRSNQYNKIAGEHNLAQLGGRVLHLGCGRSSGLDPLVDSGQIDIVNLDGRLDPLRSQQQARVQADMLHLPFADESFDAVVAHFSLSWAKKNSVYEASRVLTTGGKLLVAPVPLSYLGVARAKYLGLEKRRQQISDKLECFSIDELEFAGWCMFTYPFARVALTKTGGSQEELRANAEYLHKALKVTYQTPLKSPARLHKFRT